LDNFDNVRTTFGDLDYMVHSEASLLRDVMSRHDLQQILEIGFYHGKSSAYIAAILEDRGHGHLVTVDRTTAARRDPNIHQVLARLGLTHRVETIFAERSYTWELARMIQQSPRPQFDLCYFDGGHTWDATGFGFVLVDFLLRPGGWILFDDLPWTIGEAASGMAKEPAHWRQASADERATPAVRMVFDILVPRLGYTDLHIINNGRWGLARKPGDTGTLPALKPRRRFLKGLFG